jgi:hypothetical protein
MTYDEMHESARARITHLERIVARMANDFSKFQAQLAALGTAVANVQSIAAKAEADVAAALASAQSGAPDQALIDQATASLAGLGQNLGTVASGLTALDASVPTSPAKA